MGRCIGGSVIGGKLQELRKALEEYYGGLNELQMGLRQTVPEPPDALLLWKQCKSLNMPLFAGGLMDQPHIWLLELGVINDVEETFKAIEAVNQLKEQEQSNESRQGSQS